MLFLSYMPWSDYIATISINHLFYNMKKNCLPHKVIIKIKSNNTFRAHSYITFVSLSFSLIQSRSEVSKEIKATSVRKTDWREACVLMDYADRSSVNRGSLKISNPKHLLGVTQS